MEKQFTTASEEHVFVQKLNETRKMVMAEKPKEHLMLLEFAYNCQIVLPYKDGLAVMAALSNAELRVRDYPKPENIIPMGKDQVKCTTLSVQEYIDIKMSSLLGLSVEEMKERAPHDYRNP